MGNTKPIGVAYEDQDIIGADQIYSSGELGYTAAAQSTWNSAERTSARVTTMPRKWSARALTMKGRRRWRGGEGEARLSVRSPTRAER